MVMLRCFDIQITMITSEWYRDFIFVSIHIMYGKLYNTMLENFSCQIKNMQNCRHNVMSGCCCPYFPLEDCFGLGSPAASGRFLSGFYSWAYPWHLWAMRTSSGFSHCSQNHFLIPLDSSDLSSIYLSYIIVL